MSDKHGTDPLTVSQTNCPVDSLQIGRLYSVPDDGSFDIAVHNYKEDTINARPQWVDLMGYVRLPLSKAFPAGFDGPVIIEAMEADGTLFDRVLARPNKDIDLLLSQGKFDIEVMGLGRSLISKKTVEIK